VRCCAATKEAKDWACVILVLLWSHGGRTDGTDEMHNDFDICRTFAKCDWRRGIQPTENGPGRGQCCDFVVASIGNPVVITFLVDVRLWTEVKNTHIEYPTEHKTQSQNGSVG